MWHIVIYECATSTRPLLMDSMNFLWVSCSKWTRKIKGIHVSNQGGRERTFCLLYWFSTCLLCSLYCLPVWTLTSGMQLTSLPVSLVETFTSRLSLQWEMYIPLGSSPKLHDQGIVHSVMIVCVHLQCRHAHSTESARRILSFSSLVHLPRLFIFIAYRTRKKSLVKRVFYFGSQYAIYSAWRVVTHA